MVLIAVRAGEVNGAPIDFSCLSHRASSALVICHEGGATAPLETPLGRLLQNVMYSQGKTRGLDVKSLIRMYVRAISWQVMPAALQIAPSPRNTVPIDSNSGVIMTGHQRKSRILVLSALLVF